MKIGSEQPRQLSENLLRFQQARANALQKMQGPDPRQKLESLLKANKRGQVPMPAPQVAPSPRKSVKSPALGKGVTQIMQQTLLKANEFLMYNQDSRAAAPKTNTRNLGNYVDRVA
jgi:hypothetical protein